MPGSEAWAIARRQAETCDQVRAEHEPEKRASDAIDCLPARGGHEVVQVMHAALLGQLTEPLAVRGEIAAQ